jgi:hypothetical protein
MNHFCFGIYDKRVTLICYDDKSPYQKQAFVFVTIQTGFKFLESTGPEKAISNTIFFACIINLAKKNRFTISFVRGSSGEFPWKEHGLRVFEDRMLNTTAGRKRDSKRKLEKITSVSNCMLTLVTQYYWS